MTRRALLLPLLLASCAQPAVRPAAPGKTPPTLMVQPVRVETTITAPLPRKTVSVAAPVVERCPTLAEIRRLRAARPKPLRTQPMPASPAERVARTSAQLGQYEAAGAWADQVEEALARCEPS